MCVCVCVCVYAGKMSVCRFREWIGELFLSDVCEASIVCARVCVGARVGGCVRVCLLGSVTLTRNPTLICPLTLTTTAFQPESTKELRDAVQACRLIE